MQKHKYDKLLNCIADALDISIEEVNINSSTDNNEKWDSVGMVHLILELEQQFRIKFDISEMSELTSVKNIIKTISKKGIRF